MLEYPRLSIEELKAEVEAENEALRRRAARWYLRKTRLKRLILALFNLHPLEFIHDPAGSGLRVRGRWE